MRKIAIFLLIFIQLQAGDVDVIAGDAMDYGKNIMDGQTQGFSQNVIDPITTGSEMKSTDGSKSFEAEFTCAEAVNTDRFITVYYEFEEDMKLHVRGDFDFDGNDEKIWDFDGADGVCADGLIHCYGSWNASECSYFEWYFNENTEELRVRKVDGRAMENCFCANIECGDAAITQKKELLDVLVTGITQVIANAKPQYILTKVENDGTMAKSHAQSSDGCTQNSVGSQAGSSYTKLEEDTRKEVNYQSNNENSEYSFMGGQADNLSSNPIREDSKSFSREHIEKDKVIYSSLEGDADKMEITSMGDGTYTDSAKLADLNIEEDDSLYCKVEVKTVNSTVYSDSTISQGSNNDNNRYHTEIRKCQGDGCIYDNSFERMVEDCGADKSGFDEVTSKIVIFDQASKDMICSKK